MANRIVLNNISYHGKGAIQEIVSEVKSNGYRHLFIATDPDLLQFGVTAKVTMPALHTRFTRRSSRIPPFRTCRRV